jgi:hypothetical protein
MAPAAVLWKTFTAATWAGDEISVGRSQKDLDFWTTREDCIAAATCGIALC